VRYILSKLGLNEYIEYSHSGFGYLKDRKPRHNFDIGKRLKEYSNKKIIYMTRDPRDILVSYYYHIKFRVKKDYFDSISDYLRDDYYGAIPLKRFIIMWKDLLPNLHAFSFDYSDMHKVPEKTMGRLLDYMSLFYSYNLKGAIKESTFKQMREAELRGELEGSDVNDWRSFKVRVGEVGNYKKELSKKDINYLNELFLDII